MLVYALDRFGRNAAEVAVNKQRLKKNGKTLISATQRTSDNIDGTKNLDGIILENVYIGIAEYYSAELSQKVKRGIKESLSKGLYCGGPVSYGYIVVDKKVQVNEDEAAVVKEIFKKYAAGVIAKDIIKSLTERGIFGRKGEPFSENGIYGMLSKEKYIGIYRHDSVVYDNVYPAIVDKQTYDRVQEIRKRNKLGSRSVAENYMLSDILYCGHCRKHMVGECGTARNGERKYYYKCITRKKENACNKKNERKESVEDYVYRVCVDSFGTAENIEQMAENIVASIQSDNEMHHELNILRAEQADTQKALNNIMRAIEQGIFNETTKTRMDELEERLALLKVKVQSEETKNAQTADKDDIIAFINYAMENKYNADVLIHSLVERIILFDNAIIIFFKFDDLPKDKKTDDYYFDKAQEYIEILRKNGKSEPLLLNNGSDSPAVVER